MYIKVITLRNTYLLYGSQKLDVPLLEVQPGVLKEQVDNPHFYGALTRTLLQ